MTPDKMEEPVYGQLFTLVSADDPTLVFAWGMQVSEPDRRTAVVWRREPDGQDILGLHASADAARERFSLVTPLDLVWEPDRSTL
ncbi:hypothetical protein [Actinophytocola gossypii]|uniref:Uncharacterized protein n=1 Tax=Actinophytocola gossypii TaxID=2812003 RepID=A0ABT2JH57_9PSEU|nr:hypothetical protein [Actinophytocola gossypii]MCT2587073.1 hypothetical protein [Actinophytocola gossypii]